VLRCNKDGCPDRNWIAVTGDQFHARLFFLFFGFGKLVGKSADKQTVVGLLSCVCGRVNSYTHNEWIIINGIYAGTMFYYTRYAQKHCGLWWCIIYIYIYVYYIIYNIYILNMYTINSFYVEWKHVTGGMGGNKEKKMIKKYIFITYDHSSVCVL
jgi:hypothetical protein